MFQRALISFILLSSTCAFAQEGQILFLSETEYLDFSVAPAKLDSFKFDHADGQNSGGMSKSICDCSGNLLLTLSDDEVLGPAPQFNEFQSQWAHNASNIELLALDTSQESIYLVKSGGARSLEKLLIQGDTLFREYDSIWWDYGKSYNLDVIKARKQNAYWVSYRPQGRDIEVYLFSKQGFTLRNIQKGMTGNSGTLANGWTVGEITFSHQGNLLACVADTLGYNVYIYDFNDSTGALSSIRPIRKSSNRGYTYVGTIGLEFSPSGRFLYTCTMYTDNTGNLHAYEIEQFDLLKQNYSESRTLLAWIDHRNQKHKSSQGVYDAALGQDNRIYISPLNGNHISVINFPDRKGLSCSISLDKYETRTSVSRIIGIPPGASRAPHIFRNPDVEACADTFRFRISNAEQYRDLTIYWGDGDSLVLDSAQDISGDFTHIYEYTGTYGLSVKGRTKTCNAYLSSVDTFNILKQPKLYSGAVSSNSSCESATVAISDTVLKTQYFQVAWGDGAMKDTFLNPDSTHIIQWSHSYSQDSSYVIKKALRGRILDLQYCEMNESDTIEVHLFPQATLELHLLDQANTSSENVAEYCQNDNTRIAIGSDSTLDYSLFWGDGANSSGEIIGGQLATVAHQYSDSGTFNIKIVGKNDYGCSDTASTKVGVLHVIKAAFEIEDQSVCHRDTIRVHFPDTQNYDSAYWLFDGSRYSTEVTQVVPAWGGVIYGVTYFTQSSKFCWDTAYQVVDVQKSPDLYLSSVLVNPCENTASFEATIAHTGYQGIISINSDSFGFSSDTSVVFELVDQINEIYIVVRNQNGCSEIYRDTVALIPVNPVTILPDTSVLRCFNQQGLLMFTHDAARGNTSYWTLGSEFYQGDTFIFASMLEMGHHSLSLVYIDSNSCPAYDSLDVSIRPSPIARWSYADSSYRLNDVLVIEQLSDSMGIPIYSVQWKFDQDQNDGRRWGISLTESGVHQLQMIVSLINGCSDTLNALVEVRDQFGSSDILLYPNPTTGICTLDLKRSFNGLECSVYDLLGQTILRFDLSQNRSIVDLSGFSKGIYIVAISQDNEHLASFNVVKQ